MYETETRPLRELTGEFSDEMWTIASPGEELWIDDDRADVWTDYAENYAPDRLHLWPDRVQKALVRRCVDTETQAMNAALAEVAHTERPPRWIPAISKVAIPPEDTRPYPYGAFAAAKQQAFQHTANGLHTIEQSCVELHLNQVAGAVHDLGWQFAYVTGAPGLAVDIVRGEREVVVLTSNDHPLVNNNGLVGYDRGLTAVDARFLAFIEHAVKGHLGAEVPTSPIAAADIARFEALRSPKQPVLPGIPVPPRAPARELTKAELVAHDAHASAAAFAAAGVDVTVIDLSDPVAVAYPAGVGRHPVDLGTPQPPEAVPDRAPQM